MQVPCTSHRRVLELLLAGMWKLRVEGWAGFVWNRVNFPHRVWSCVLDFVLEAGQVTLGCFSSCRAVIITQHWGLFCLSPQPISEDGECTMGCEGTWPGQVTPTGQRDIPDPLPSCSAYKAGGEEGSGGCLR